MGERTGWRLLEVGVRWPPETFLHRKFRGLIEEGVEVTVASPVGRRRGRRHRQPGVRLLHLHHPGETRLMTAALTVLFASRLAVRDPRLLVRLLHSTRPWRLLRNVLPVALSRSDVLHFEWEAQGVRYLPVLEALGRPVVVSCRGAGVAAHPHAGLERVSSRYPELFAKASAVHCVSEEMLNEATRFGLDPTKATVIRSGVDSTFFSPGARERSSCFRILSVGSLHWIKNLEDGVRAASLLAVSGVPVRYEIAGPEPPAGDPVKTSDRARLLYLAHELGLGDQLILLGELSHLEIRERLRTTDALVLTSIAEGIPNCVLEAMACAVPVVVTDRGGTVEAVRDGVEGFVCPARDPEALAKRLRRLWDDPGLARRLGDAGRARTLADFSRERELAETLRMYDGGLGPAPGLR